MKTPRDEALIAAWEACGQPCGMGDWFMAFESWDIQPVKVDGGVVGAVFARGPEIHVAVRPEHHRRWCTPRLYRWAITDRLKRYGWLFTKGKADNEFIRRAGFEPVSVINGTTLFVRR